MASPLDSCSKPRFQKFESGMPCPGDFGDREPSPGARALIGAIQCDPMSSGFPTFSKVFSREFHRGFHDSRGFSMIFHKAKARNNKGSALLRVELRVELIP